MTGSPNLMLTKVPHYTVKLIIRKAQAWHVSSTSKPNSIPRVVHMRELKKNNFLNQPANFCTGLCIANSGCTALYCSCAYQTHAPLLYFDPYLLLGFGVQIIEIGLGRATLIYGTQPVILNVCIDMPCSAYSFRPLLKYSCKLHTIYII